MEGLWIKVSCGGHTGSARAAIVSERACPCLSQEDTIKFMGSTLVTRMTVVALPAAAEHGSEETKTAVADAASGVRLFVHSPTPLSPQLQTDLSKLGTVAFIVSPNKIHNMSMPEWAKAYPEAKMIASPGLEARRPDVKFHATLEDAPSPEWADVLDQVNQAQTCVRRHADCCLVLSLFADADAGEFLLLGGGFLSQAIPHIDHLRHARVDARQLHGQHGVFAGLLLRMGHPQAQVLRKPRAPVVYGGYGGCGTHPSTNLGVGVQ